MNPNDNAHNSPADRNVNDFGRVIIGIDRNTSALNAIIEQKPEIANLLNDK